MLREISSVADGRVRIGDLMPGDIVRFLEDGDTMIIGNEGECISLDTGAQYTVAAFEDWELVRVAEGALFRVSQKGES